MDFSLFFFILVFLAIIFGISLFLSGKKEGEAKGKEDGKKAAEKAAFRKSIEDACNKVPNFGVLSKDEQKEIIDTITNAKPAKTPNAAASLTDSDNMDKSFILFLVIFAFIIWAIFFG